MTREAILEALRAARSALDDDKPTTEEERLQHDELYAQWINVMFYTLCEPFELQGESGPTCWLHELTAEQKGAHLVPFFAPPLARYGDALHAVVQLLAAVSRSSSSSLRSKQRSLELGDAGSLARPARERWVALECAAIVRALHTKHVGEILRDGGVGFERSESLRARESTTRWVGRKGAWRLEGGAQRRSARLSPFVCSPLLCCALLSFALPLPLLCLCSASAVAPFP